MTQKLYTELYTIAIFSIVVLFCLYLCSYKDRQHILPLFSSKFAVILAVMLIWSIACCPGGWGSDKQRYEVMFCHAEHLSFSKDILWQYYNLFAKYLLHDSFLFFLCTATFYVWSSYQFVRQYVDKEKRLYLFLLIIISLGFWGYGMNTIRAGVALGFFLLALSKRNNQILFIILSALSIGFHKSLFIPVGAYLFSIYYKKTKYYCFIWLLMLICSAMNITSIADFIQSLFLEYDDRVSGYMLATQNRLYAKAGFRIDFIIYSLFPIVIGWYYVFRKRFSDAFYIRIFNMYLIINAFWLLIIRIPYTDRFAYLSWFLAPFILIYPLLKDEHLVHAQPIKLAGIIFVMGFLNFALTVLR